ncbi:hypothetical protein VTK73DRAFT_8520 [Phialemonium thermophilum]|uniref:Uncharacterized protein n=1 Tax=Phialemonium thermophilum TaxID=223376 RepID=A0ABR3W8P7_9PEZI
MVPASLLSGIILLARDEMPTWPPSPAWAMTLYPFVQFTYSNLYWEFFGSLEKRLNRALRGRPAEDEPPQQPARQRDAVQQGEQQGEQQQQQQQQQQGEEEEGLGAVLWGLGNAVVGLFRDEHEVVVQAEVVHVDDEHQDEFNEEDEDAQIEAELERLEREVVGDQAAAEEQGQEDRHEGQNEGAEAGAADGVVVAQPQQEGQAQDPIPAPPPPPPEENNNNNNRIANTTLTDIVNNVVTSLLYPCICFGMGELLRLTLPRRLVTRPSFGRPTGLLQERWGRSLAGGCLYVVLKDAFLLYAKYRRVYVKQHRKIRNVERRR